MLVDQDAKTTEIYGLFTAPLAIIREVLAFYGEDNKLIDFLAAIKSYNATSANFWEIRRQQDYYARHKRYFFCAKCGQPIKTQAGCQACFTGKIFLYDLPSLNIDYLNLAMPETALDMSKTIDWQGKGQEMDSKYGQAMLQLYLQREQKK